MRCLPIKLLISALVAQVALPQLATTDDGSDVAFASAAWHLRSDNSGPGIFRWAQGTWTTPATAGSNMLSDPFLTGDGSLLLWERNSPCFGPCMFALPRSFSEFDHPTAPVRITPYQLRISHNGRWVLTPGFIGISDFALQDLETGSTWTPPVAPYLRVFNVADDGSVIGLEAARADGGITTALVPNRLVLWKPGGTAIELMQSTAIRKALVSADGRTAVVETYAPQAVWRVDVGSGARVQIAAQSDNAVRDSLRAISNDGTRILFVTPGQNEQLMLFDGTMREILHADEGIGSAALSGDGRVVWAMTASNRLLRIDAQTGEQTEFLPPLPSILQQASWGSAPGSAVVLRGEGPFEGLEFSKDDLRFPVVDKSERSFVTIQIPWEATPKGEPVSLLVRRPDHPFETAAITYIQPNVTPAIATQLTSYDRVWAKAALPGFEGLVSRQTPALAGTTIHVWLFGLGPLDRSVPTGVPGPSDPLAHPLAPLACYLRGTNNQPAARGLELPLVAYAPGLIGAYQVDVRIPTDWPAGEHELSCESNSGFITSAWLPVSH